MKTIKRLTVRVTYEVELMGIEVPTFVAEDMEEAYNDGYGTVDEDTLAYEWMTDNIHETDANTLEYEITDFEEEN